MDLDTEDDIYCSVGEGNVWVATRVVGNGKEQNKWENVSTQLLTVCVDTDLDGRRRDEDLDEPILERLHAPLLLCGAHASMHKADPQLRQRLGQHAITRFGGLVVEAPEPWDFDAGVNSIAISGHKMIGSPLPCGVVLAEKAAVDRIARKIDYVGTLDTTLLGSRNAITLPRYI